MGAAVQKRVTDAVKVPDFAGLTVPQKQQNIEH